MAVAATLVCPGSLLNSIYAPNKNKGRSWSGKGSCLTISFDCDYPRDAEALPAVLTMLDKYPFKTSFACVGHWIEKYPREHRLILEHGHEILNHTYSHPDNELLNPGRKFRTIPRAEKMEEIRRCHDICKEILHYEPRGCRIPHFRRLFTPEIYGILRELNYRYSSSTWTTATSSNGLPFTAAEGIIEFPLSTCPRHPFTVFDTWHSLNSNRLFYTLIHRSKKDYLALLRELIDIGINTNSYINIYIDPYDLVEMPEFTRILDYLKERAGRIRIATYEEIVKSL